MDLDSESDKSSSSAAPMDLDKSSSSAAAAIEEERPKKKGKHPMYGLKVADSEEYRDMALNRYSELSRSEQRGILLTACSVILDQEMLLYWSNKTLLRDEDMEEIKALALKKAESMIGEDASARIRKKGLQPSIINDDIRNEILERWQDYWMKMEALTMRRRELYLKNKLKNKSSDDDQGACSFHQSDDQKRKEMLEKKATEMKFPDFVW